MEIPKRLFLEITHECNLRCQLCKLWQRKDPPNRLTLKEKIQFLENLFDWLESNKQRFREKFRIILTGGEPFLLNNQVLEISKFCRINDINCSINTNGSLIEPMIGDVLNSGLTALTFSLDSHISRIHDDLRGSQGLFNKLVSTIKLIIKRKEQNSFPINICVQSILGNWNIDKLPAHVSFLKELGLDGMMFQLIQYPFGLFIPKNWHKNFKNFPQSEKKVQSAINYLLKLKQNNGFIMNSTEEIESWQQYFSNPEYIPNKINPCRSYEQNLIVDVCGNVKFCFNKVIEPLDKIGNILTTPIDILWNGKLALEIKDNMKACNRSCGVMACHIDASMRRE